MGGSCFGYYILKTVFSDQLKIPLVLANSYTLPGFVTTDTLVLAQSYSGNTEETISCLKEAQNRNALLTAVTSGGEIADILSSNQISFYLFQPQFNPSGQPRLAAGYTLFSLLGILVNLGLISIKNEEITNALNFLEEQKENQQQEANNLAKSLKDKQPLIIASQHLSGNAHILRNQFNETAKNFADYSLIPELNHHLLEGLAHPLANQKTLVILALTSSFYSERIKKRLELTLDVVAKNNIETKTINVVGDTKFKQVLWLLSYGGYLTYYLAKEYGVNPLAVPWVDYFKKKLKE